MNKIKTLAVFGFFLLGSLFAFKENALAQDSSWDAIFTPNAELKAGYFIFANQKMRNVYKDGGFQIQLSGSYPIRNCLHIYSSLGFIEVQGKSIHFKQKTTFRQIPVDLGLKPIFNISSCLNWYAAIGPRYFYAHQRNHSNSVNKSLGKSGIGMFANTGFEFFPTCNCFINLFGEYSYESIRPSSSKRGVHKRNIQVGGFSFGAGLGYSF